MVEAQEVRATDSPDAVKLFEVDSGTIGDTNGLTTTSLVFSWAIDTLHTIPAHGAAITTYTNMARLALTKANAANNMNVAWSGLVVAPVWS